VKNPNQQWGQTLSIKKATLPITAVVYIRQKKKFSFYITKARNCDFPFLTIRNCGLHTNMIN
jgi:hypothetical protein